MRGDEPARAVPINDWLKQAVADAPLSMRFKGTSADEACVWQKEFAAKLNTLLGPHAPPAKWKTIVVQTWKLDDHRREELLLVADGYPPLPVYLLSPIAKGKRRPGIVAIHGHGEHGHHAVAGRDDLPGVAAAIKSANYDYGRQLVRQGYVVAVPCLTPFGDRLRGRGLNGKIDACGDTFMRMQMLGKVLMAENVRDCRWALEMLARHEDVDADRLGCVGLSLGGRMTMMTTALEPRIKVAVIAGALNVMQERISKPYGCGAQMIPGLLLYGDVPEIASLIAPRPVLWQVGSRDKLIDPVWADDALNRQRRVYKALAAENQLMVDRFDGGHVWHGEAGEALLGKILQP
jgi:dienelactone hydrolase